MNPLDKTTVKAYQAALKLGKAKAIARFTCISCKSRGQPGVKSLKGWICNTCLINANT